MSVTSVALEVVNALDTKKIIVLLTNWRIGFFLKAAGIIQYLDGKTDDISGAKMEIKQNSSNCKFTN